MFRFAKKLAVLFYLIPLITIFIGISGTAHAAPVDPNNLFFNKSIEWFTKNPTTADAAKQYPELSAVDNLPNVSIEGAIAMAIKTILKVTFYLTLISLALVATYYIMSQGKEEDLTKAKSIILFLIIGMAVIAASYGVVSGLSRFNFFSADVGKDKIQEAEYNTK